MHGRGVKPRTELPEEDELFVSSQPQSFREQVQEHVIEHVVEEIGAHTVFANSVSENLETTSKDDGHSHHDPDDQGVELRLDVSWNDLGNFKQNRTPHAISSLQRFAKVQK